MGKFYSFEEARNIARGLRLSGESEWRKYCRGKMKSDKGSKPQKIPSNPNRYYRDTGWVSWGDWLGTNNIATQKMKYKNFEDARTFARNLKLKGKKNWDNFCKNNNLPADIPKSPHYHYEADWVDWYDWLGNENQRRDFQPYDEARKFVITLRILSAKMWAEYCKGKHTHLTPLPKDIPRKPADTYRDKGWKNWGHFLGTSIIDTKRKTFLNFQEAKGMIEKLGISSAKEWRKYCRGSLKNSFGTKPDCIPSNPDVSYRKDGWSGWSDWLGKKKCEN